MASASTLGHGLSATLLCASLLAAAASPQAGSGIDPRALLEKSQALMRGSGTEGVYRVRIVRPGGERVLRLRSLDDAVNDRQRLEMLEPRKVKGTLFLKVGRRLSMYLPKLRREIAISPAMMQDPWMGSDLNNQDLLESSALIEQYSHRVLQREGDVVAIESVPKPDAIASWLRLVHRIREDGLPLEVRYYCKKGERDRVMRFEAPEERDGRVVPTRWVMQPAARPDERTVIEVEEIRFDVRPADELFHPNPAADPGR